MGCHYAGRMAKRKKTKRRAVPRKRRWASRVRLALALVLALALIPMALTTLYIVIRPVSTLMIYERVAVGPVEHKWVRFEDISRSLVASVIMAEDGKYCAHKGVDWVELNKALDDIDGRPRGASTIAMQTVKNLFLWSSRSYVRKTIEIPLALYADKILGKRRLMEIYLNIAEFGPGIFGVAAAARHYFGRSAAELSRRQSALLTASLPNPAARDPADPDPGLEARARAIEQQADIAGAYIVCLNP